MFGPESWWAIFSVTSDQMLSLWGRFCYVCQMHTMSFCILLDGLSMWLRLHYRMIIPGSLWGACFTVLRHLLKTSLFTKTFSICWDKCVWGFCFHLCFQLPCHFYIYNLFYCIVVIEYFISCKLLKDPVYRTG